MALYFGQDDPDGTNQWFWSMPHKHRAICEASLPQPIFLRKTKTITNNYRPKRQIFTGKIYIYIYIYNSPWYTVDYSKSVTFMDLTYKIQLLVSVGYSASLYWHSDMTVLLLFSFSHQIWAHWWVSTCPVYKTFLESSFSYVSPGSWAWLESYSPSS